MNRVLNVPAVPYTLDGYLAEKEYRVLSLRLEREFDADEPLCADIARLMRHKERVTQDAIRWAKRATATAWELTAERQRPLTFRERLLGRKRP